MNNNKKKYIIYGIVLFIVIVSVSTFAWLTWKSRGSNLVMVIGDRNSSSVTLFPYEINTSLSPKLTYDVSDYVSVTANNNNSMPTFFDLYYEIDSESDSELLTSSLKWNLLKSIDGGSTYSEYKSGNFSTVSSNKLMLMEEKVPAHTDYDYKLCIWLDGSSGNQSSLSSKKIKASLKADLMYVDHTYLTTLGEGTYFKNATYIDKIKTVSFVNYVNTNNALATYDLSLNQDNSVIGWIDSNYNLYIGSEWKIYARNLASAFYNMTALTSINFSNLDTRENTSLRNIFYGASSLTNLDLSTFDTSNVTSMRGVFFGCSSLTSLNLSNFDTSKVTDFGYMFYTCSSLNNLNISSFDTSSATSMESMFQYCSLLTSLDLSNFNTSKVTNMYAMFAQCFHLTSLDVSSFDTSKVTNMYAMFISNTKLISLDLSNFNTSSVTDTRQMFRVCSSLERLYLDNANFSNVTNSTDMFLDTKSSVKVYVKDSVAKTFIENQGITSSNVIIA